MPSKVTEKENGKNNEATTQTIEKQNPESKANVEPSKGQELRENEDPMDNQKARENEDAPVSKGPRTHRNKAVESSEQEHLEPIGSKQKRDHEETKGTEETRGNVDYGLHRNKASEQQNQKSSANEEPICNKQRRLYYAVRKCKPLKAPAIFLSLEDCNWLISVEQGRASIEYEKFDSVEDALKYVNKVDAYEPHLSKKRKLASAEKDAKVLAAENDPQSGNETKETDVSKENSSKIVAAKDDVGGKAAESPDEKDASKDACDLEISGDKSPAAVKRGKRKRKKKDIPRRSKRKKARVASHVEVEIDDDGDDEDYECDSDENNLEDDPETPQTRCTRPKNYFEDWREQWNDMFKLLSKYKEKFGSLNVPTSTEKLEGFESLGSWVGTVRYEIKKYQKNPSDDSSFLDDKKVESLQALGFCVNSKRASQISGIWEERFQGLLEYHARNGHCDVTRKEDSLLYGFTSRLRKDYAKLKAGKRTKLTGPKIAQLVEIGFRFSLHSSNKIPINNRDDMFEDLVEFKKKHGHCLVPVREKKLYRWITKTRDEYRKTMAGKPSSLTAKRVADLIKLGFKFHGKKGRHDWWQEDWAEMIQMLKEYKEKFGTMDVPYSIDEDDGFENLGNFVTTVRKFVKKFKKDPSSSSFLDDAKIKELEDMGFVFECNRAKKADDTIAEPTKKLKNLDKNWQQSWENRVLMLERYKFKYGTADVPNAQNLEGFGGLGRWVATVRHHLREFQEDPTSCPFLDDAKVNRLLKLGFVLEPKKGPKNGPTHEQSSSDGSWERMFGELQKFKEENGHCNVPVNQKSELANWVIRMRNEYEKLMAGKMSKLTAQRVAQMTELGFRLKKAKTMSFEERARQWKEFKEQHGADPKRQSEDGLGRWLVETRFKYKQLKKGKPTNLTQERADLLTSWGFKWESEFKQPKNKRKPQTWEKSFEDLLGYKERHGHLLVPQHHPQLGQWVHRQRRGYKKFVEGKKSHLDPEKIAKLNAVGFPFSLRQMRGKRGHSTGALTRYDPDNSSEDEDEDDGDEDENALSQR